MKNITLCLSLLIAAISQHLYPQMSLAMAPLKPQAAASQPTRPAGDLLKGATFSYRANKDQPFAAELLTFKTGHGNKGNFDAICKFNMPADAKPMSVCLQLAMTDFGITKATLNGKPVQFPLADMYYREAFIQNPDFQPGENVMELSFFANIVDQAHPNLAERLFMSPTGPADLKFIAAPILGAVWQEHFSVTCETNLPSKVTIQSASGQNVLATSDSNTVHRMKVPRDQAGRYVLIATNGQVTLKTDLNPPPFPSADKLKFVVAGDTKNAGPRWAITAAAAIAHKPELIVRLGDFVNIGQMRWEWDSDFLNHAADMQTSVPHYAVRGNHEGNASIFKQLFYTPGDDSQAANWSQRVGPALLIGVDGRTRFTDGTKERKWLEGVLDGSGDAKFIFLFNHHPVMGSCKQTLVKDGKIAEKPSQRAFDDILPLLAKHKATAYLSGHSHMYERLEPASGPTCIISGGAGAHLHKKTWDAPDSKVQVSKHHYCLFEIDGDTCTLRALTPDGKEVDKKVWQARTPAKP